MTLRKILNENGVSGLMEGLDTPTIPVMMNTSGTQGLTRVDQRLTARKKGVWVRLCLNSGQSRSKAMSTVTRLLRKVTVTALAFTLVLSHRRGAIIIALCGYVQCVCVVLSDRVTKYGSA